MSFFSDLVDATDNGFKRVANLLKNKADKTELDNYYTSLAVQSRGMNLITNGSGLMLNNYNFSGYEFYQTDTYGGGGSFLNSNQYGGEPIDEFVAVDVNKTYKFEAYLKSVVLGVNNKAFMVIVAYDIEKNLIGSEHWRNHNNVTKLAQPLRLGDNVIYLESVAGWDNAYTSTRHIKIHEYTNKFGFKWAPETYSRSITGRRAYNNENIDTVNNTITLNYAWDVANPETEDGHWPVGTIISTSQGGDTAFYASSLRNDPVPNVWTKYEGVVDASVLKPGVAFIKIGWYLNRGDRSANPSNQTAISNVYMTEITSENLTNGKSVYTGSLQTADGQTLNVVNGLIVSD